VSAVGEKRVPAKHCVLEEITDIAFDRTKRRKKAKLQ